MNAFFSQPPRTIARVALVLGFCLGPWVFAAETNAPKSKEAKDGGWQALFDGKTLKGWAPSGFEGEGTVKVVSPFKDGQGAILIEKGAMLSGITRVDRAGLPRMNYEITLEAMRLEGSDFFCGLTFPVADSACTLVCGGWGGTLVGISSIDHNDASENETSTGLEFANDRWYRIRVRVTEEKLEAWIDAEQVVDFEWKGRKITMRPGDIEKSQPLGIASYMTRSAVRDIRIRRL